MPPVSPNGVPFCSSIASSRSSARITPEHRPEALRLVEPRAGADAEADAGRPRPVVAADARRLDEPRLAGVEHRQAAAKHRAGRGDQRSHRRRRVGRPAHAQRAHGLGEPPQERCRRARSGSRISRLAAEHFWPAWPKAERTMSPIARSTSAAPVTTIAFLPLVSASSRSARLPVEEHPGGGVGPGEHDGVDRRVRDQSPADVVVGTGDVLQDVGRDAGAPALLHEQPRGAPGLRRRLEDHGVAGHQRGEHAAGGDGVGEVPRGGDDHHALRRRAPGGSVEAAA